MWSSLSEAGNVDVCCEIFLGFHRYKADAVRRMKPLWEGYFNNRMKDAVPPRTLSCCTKWAASDRFSTNYSEWRFEYDHVFYSDDLMEVSLKASPCRESRGSLVLSLSADARSSDDVTSHSRCRPPCRHSCRTTTRGARHSVQTRRAQARTRRATRRLPAKAAGTVLSTQR